MCLAHFLKCILLWNSADWKQIPPAPYLKSACKDSPPVGSRLTLYAVLYVQCYIHVVFSLAYYGVSALVFKGQ